MNTSNTNSKPLQETKAKPCAIKYVWHQLKEVTIAITEHRSNKQEHFQNLGYSSAILRSTPDPTLKKFEAKKLRLINTLKFLQR